MYRKSSKGNPYHDAKGRFARKDGSMAETEEEALAKMLIIKNKDGEIIDDKRPVMWSSFGEKVDLKKKTNDQIKKIDKNKTNSHMTDGKRFYHNQSISREKHARSVSFAEIPKGLSMAERSARYKKAKADFAKENSVAIKNGGSVRAFCAGNTISYQVVESKRMALETTKKASKVTRSTSTSMKMFSGYTVEYFKDNEVRSCPNETTYDQANKGISKFCSKHNKTMSNDNVCMAVWRDGTGKRGRLRYMPSYRFDTKEEAEAFAKEHKGATVVNHDDGSMA